MKSRKLYSTVMVRKESEILLGFKLRGFGVGKWDGFGGKLEPNETMHECAVRELREECGLIAKDLRLLAILDFEYEGNPTIMECHIYETFNFEGDPVETDEMRPKWFKLSDIPFKEMWPDNSLWYPYMFKGSLFKGYYLYRGEETILEQRFEEVTELP